MKSYTFKEAGGGHSFIGVNRQEDGRYTINISRFGKDGYYQASNSPIYKSQEKGDVSSFLDYLTRIEGGELITD